MSPIIVYEEGSPDDPYEKVCKTFIDWMMEVQRMLEKLDALEVERILKKLDRARKDSPFGPVPSFELLYREVRTFIAVRAMIARMDAAGASWWCVTHDCDGETCPPGEHADLDSDGEMEPDGEDEVEPSLVPSSTN